VDAKVFEKTMRIRREFMKKGILGEVGLVVKGFNNKLDYIGTDVKDADCLLVDSIIDAGDTLVKVSNLLKKTRGASNFHVCDTWVVNRKGCEND